MKRVAKAEVGRRVRDLALVIGAKLNLHIGGSPTRYCVQSETGAHDLSPYLIAREMMTWLDGAFAAHWLGRDVANGTVRK